jgi:hypothetical protein
VDEDSWGYLPGDGYGEQPRAVEHIANNFRDLDLAMRFSSQDPQIEMHLRIRTLRVSMN